ncbi:uncharacterized protein LOC132735000 [Ruditapes philippinarum]|uniref:uncharacterized protein LOC132735000 n=1 Tax=Ruditapes philippinarum TaxID=129788 RepID=UPI00295B0B6C|nr:uncharacterized protein LOC132735000 [Ruditapes philippinarum]
MPSYIVFDVKTRKVIITCTVTGLVMFAIGIGIGYASRKGSSNTDSPTASVAEAIRATCSGPAAQTPSGKLYFDRFVQRHNEKYACVKTKEECWNLGLPRNYIAYHLNGKTITIDGKLDDDAWKEVPWSETFVDMRSSVYPKPYLDTKFKIRWDDERMYIGVYIQENNLWATLTTHDAAISTENGVEFLMDVDGSLFNFKQMQINVLGTMMDQLFYKSPYDSPDVQVWFQDWQPDVRKAVNTDGTVNTPGDEDKYWSIEVSLSFAKLAERSQRAQPNPVENEAWFIQFGRSEQNLTVEKGQYKIVPGSESQWWSWQQCDTINLLLQDRWGLVQFKKNLSDKKFRFDRWHIYKALFVMRDAMKKFQSVNGKYTNKIEELDVPPYLLSGTCVEVPEITFTFKNNAIAFNYVTNPITGFVVTVKSKLISHKPAHIRSDRYVTFQ